MADTWNENAGNQLCTGNAVRDGASTAGLFTLIIAIPTVLNKEVLTVNQVSTYTGIGEYNFYGLTSNQCPTKNAIISAYYSSL